MKTKKAEDVADFFYQIGMCTTFTDLQFPVVISVLSPTVKIALEKEHPWSFPSLSKHVYMTPFTIDNIHIKILKIIVVTHTER